MARTLENQFVFQKPGVPHGQESVPPESRQPRAWKSLLNQKFIAFEIANRMVGSWTYCSAPANPP